MAKKRIAIPQKTQIQVMKEFNHSCAICGSKQPQIHHIDENPANNDPSNLLPLCPNCHLTDQHNPTAIISPRKLSLFRQYKDPSILHSKFEPLFHRFIFLDQIEDGSNGHELEMKCRELVDFVKALQMGDFYSQRIMELVGRRGYLGVVGEDIADDIARARLRDREYREKLKNAREQVYFLAIELLRYQNWDPARPLNGSGSR